MSARFRQAFETPHSRVWPVSTILWLALPLLAVIGCAGERPTPPTPPHLLFISADSLRADRLELFTGGSDGVATPRLEALAERGTVYRRMWAVAPWTAPSMVSSFTGLYPPRHGVAYRDDTTPGGLPTLPRLLAAAGYRVGNFSFFTAISYFRNLGFPEPARGLRHGRELDAFERWLDEGRDEERPFFAWLHLLHPHLPYGASGYRSREVQVAGSTGLEGAQLKSTLPVGSAEFAAGDRDRLLALYDADIVELDRDLGRLLSILERRGLLERTLVLFVADHGEELLEHGWVGHASTAMEAKLVPEILHIPLVLAGPGIVTGEVSDRLVQHVDLLPTLLDALSLPAVADLDGESLLAPFELGARLKRFFFGSAGRRFVFFDSSPGGNLTPPERRNERLQGVSDGDCLLTSHTLSGEERTGLLELAERGCDADRLASALERWRERQLTGRLDVLRQHAAEGGPSPEEAESYVEQVEVLRPPHGATLGWGDGSGQLVIEWRGEGPGFWVEYDIGSGPLRVKGAFEVEQERLVFGPFPVGFWNDLAGYSPFRFRVLDPEHRQRSAWQRFDVLPEG